MGGSEAERVTAFGNDARRQAWDRVRCTEVKADHRLKSPPAESYKHSPKPILSKEGAAAYEAYNPRGVPRDNPISFGYKRHRIMGNQPFVYYEMNIGEWGSGLAPYSALAEYSKPLGLRGEAPMRLDRADIVNCSVARYATGSEKIGERYHGYFQELSRQNAVAIELWPNLRFGKARDTTDQSLCHVQGFRDYANCGNEIQQKKKKEPPPPISI